MCIRDSNKYKSLMDYEEYRRLGLPIGSGVTEAACKTVFTQRFKESGMSWGINGGAVILTLRLAKLSRIWETVYRQYLASRPLPTLATNPSSSVVDVSPLAAMFGGRIFPLH